jgi:hypothetical protein
MSSIPSLPMFRCVRCSGHEFRLFESTPGIAVFVECTNCHETTRLEPKAQLSLTPDGRLTTAPAGAAGGGGGGGNAGP